MKALKLHEHFEQFIDEVCDLINEEWPRSKEIRKSMLANSSDKLPCSIIVVDTMEDGKNVVLGHARILDSGTQDFVIETVIVRRNVRGKGIGNFLMSSSEQFLVKYFETQNTPPEKRVLSLKTHTAEKFYAKLNYRLCEPILSAGKVTSNLGGEALQKLSQLFGTPNTNASKLNPGEVWMNKHF